MANEDFLNKIAKQCFEVLVQPQNGYCLMVELANCPNHPSWPSNCQKKYYKTNAVACSKWICKSEEAEGPRQTTTTSPIATSTTATEIPTWPSGSYESNNGNNGNTINIELAGAVSATTFLLLLIVAVTISAIVWRRRRATVTSELNSVRCPSHEISISLPMEPMGAVAGIRRTPLRTQKVDDEIEFNYYTPPSYSEAMEDVLPTTGNESRNDDVRRQQQRRLHMQQQRINWTPFRKPLRTFSPS